ncbi:hypothetical protein Tco_1379401 [Tanacetum coccineum]
MSGKMVLTLDKDNESIDSTKYRGMIGSLFYLTASRPDIMFSVCLCARFYEDPKVSYLEGLKGYLVDRKSTSGICTFVGSCLTSWFSKKQTSRANSIIESNYVAAGRACQQALWMKQAFVDYNIMINEALKEARMELREMLLSIQHSLKMLLDIISKMNRKLED